MRAGGGQKWGRVARALHWSVALMLPAMAVLGLMAESEADRDESFRLIRAHFQLGIVVATLIVARIGWRLAVRAPAPIPDGPPWQRHMATVVHLLIYLALIVLPISGYIVWVHMTEAMDVFGLFDVPRAFTPRYDDERLRAGAWYVHRYIGWGLAALVALHVAATLWHAMRRDGVLRRMI